MLFFDHVPGLKYRAALMLCYGAGLRISEAVAIRAGDIDSPRGLLRVENGKGGKARLHPAFAPAAGGAARVPAADASGLAAAAESGRGRPPVSVSLLAHRLAPVGRHVANRLPGSLAALGAAQVPRTGNGCPAGQASSCPCGCCRGCSAPCLCGCWSEPSGAENSASAASAGPWQVLQYLSRYTHRVAISNDRLVDCDDRTVSFRWKDYRNHHRPGVMKLEASEFLRRFLLHTVPAGVQRIRHYGWLSNRHRQAALELCRRLLATPVSDLLPRPPHEDRDLDPPLPGDNLRPCPQCRGPMRVIEILAPLRPHPRMDSS